MTYATYKHGTRPESGKLLLNKCSLKIRDNNHTTRNSLTSFKKLAAKTQKQTDDDVSINDVIAADNDGAVVSSRRKKQRFWLKQKQHRQPEARKVADAAAEFGRCLPACLLATHSGKSADIVKKKVLWIFKFFDWFESQINSALNGTKTT